MEPAPRINIENEEGNCDDNREDGADLGELDADDRLGRPCEMRLTSRLFAK